MPRRRRREMQGEVQLNLAAMLDMAFQLLAFFILTFKPAATEGHIALRMPPAKPITRVEQAQATGADTKNPNPIQGLDTLVVTAVSDASGGIDALRIGEGEATRSLRVFEDRLVVAFGTPTSPFQQVILQVGSGLRYQCLMELLDVCTRVKLPSGEKLTKVSFVELPERDLATGSAPPGRAES